MSVINNNPANPGQVRTDHQEASLPPLRAPAVLQVLGQGDAHHEVQPGQARQGVRRLLRPPDTRGGGRGNPFWFYTIDDHYEIIKYRTSFYCDP